VSLAGIREKLLRWCASLLDRDGSNFSSYLGVAQGSATVAFTSLCSAIGLAVASVECPKWQHLDTFTKMCTKFNIFSNAFSKFPNVVEFFLLNAEKLLKFASAFVNTDSLLQWLEHNTSLGIRKFIDNAEIVLAADPMELALEDDGLYDVVVKNLLERGKEIQDYVIINGYTDKTMCIKHILKRCEEIIEKRQKQRLAIGGRLTPFCVYYFGDPGIGKSTILRSVVDEILYTVPIPDRLYMRNTAVEYWDGYTNQQAIGIDDFAASTQCNFEELVNIVSTNPMVLNMAAIDKGNPAGCKGTMLTAKLVIIMSNTGWPSVCGGNEVNMKCADAVYRRRHMLWRACLNNNQRVPNSYDHLSFWLCDSMTPNSKQRGPFSYEEMLRLTKETYDVHMDNEIKLQHQLIRQRFLRDEMRKIRDEIICRPLASAQGLLDLLEVGLQTVGNASIGCTNVMVAAMSL